MLKIENLNVFYGGIHALRGVSLQIEQEEIVTIIGANGAGKSTLLKAISGLVKYQGDIIFEGHSLQRLRPHIIVKAGISHVPEGRRVFANLSVRENLEMGAYLVSGRVKLASLEKVYALFPRLREREKQSAGTLSGGEQQMLAIGRAMMATPRLLLLDEPSLGLAPKLVNEIFKTIKDINEKGTTVLLVEQNANKALAIAQRAYVLETGALVMAGLAQEVAGDPRIKEVYLGKKHSA
ncbi:MAG: branched-chain amino acid transport system ATP-binding protein [Clostridia bacterium]|nr:branched-chain amino acid transport system ATP-binding protein [Clostridia bacterium]